MTVYMFTDVSLSPENKLGAYAYQVHCFKEFKPHFFAQASNDFSDEKIIGSGLFKDPMEHPSIAEMKCILFAFKELSAKPFANEIKNVIVNADNLDAIWLFTNKVAKGRNKEENALVLSEIENITSSMTGLENIRYCHIKAHQTSPSAKYQIHRWCDMESRRLLRSEVKTTDENIEAEELTATISQDKEIKNSIHIPIYKKNSEEKFEIVGEDIYEVTYLHGKRLKLRIVVNGYLTHQNISLGNYHTGYKDSILRAISEYRNANIKNKENLVRRKIKFDSLKCYSKQIQNNVRDILLPINKEVRRDTLTQYGLIKEEKTKKEFWLFRIFKKLYNAKTNF